MSIFKRREAKYPLQGLADLPDSYGKWKTIEYSYRPIYGGGTDILR